MSIPKEKLDRILEDYNQREFLEDDPLGILHQYDRKMDIETVGMIASALSFGRKNTFIEKIHQITDVLGNTPGRSLKNEVKTLSRRLHDFSYRWVDGNDLRDLLYAIYSSLHKYGSLENVYAQAGGDDHLERCNQFVRILRERAVRNTITRGFKYLLPDPSNGSACKRLHMFFRWMVREDPDMDVWSTIDTSDLVIPLDTHVHDKALECGLTERKTADLKAAKDITESLREFDPQDPVKYDVALHIAGVNEIPLGDSNDEI